MALNKYMHPRNVYKDRKPNFKKLAEKYEEFHKHVLHDDHGTVQIDFKKPECLRALSWALLKDDFNLDVLMPLDRLIPTIPLRLNYILWLEDILDRETETICGIDIGTGASCVYPLLGAKKNGWSFIATESDGTNYQYAKKNVENNQMTDKIKVLHVPDGSSLHDVLVENSETYNFCMCNPPFYGSNFEAWGMLTSRSDNRPEPSSVSTASPVESIVPGGEVHFVKQMISDSTLLKQRISLHHYARKKSSISILKEELKINGVTNVSTTEFCQGKTMRWGLGWSFDATVTFPKPPSKAIKAQKPRPPLIYHIPKQSQLDIYTLDQISEKMLGIFQQLQISVTDMKKSKEQIMFTITATVNTWSHQRRKRRQQKATSSDVLDATHHLKSSDSGTEKKSDTHKAVYNTIQNVESVSVADAAPETCTKKLKPSDPEQELLHIAHQEQQSNQNSEKMNDLSIERCRTYNSPNGNTTATPKISSTNLVEDKTQTTSPNPDINSLAQATNETNTSSMMVSFSMEKTESKPSYDKTVPFSAVVTISHKYSDTISVELLWLKGENREAMHQVLQYIKNKLQ